MRVTVDIVLFTLRPDGAATLEVLLVERGVPPYEGTWALPGGFVHPDESLETAARRELREETGVDDVYLEQLYSFGDPGRDPRGRVVTVAYYALVSPDRRPPEAGTDARAARFWPVAALPKLAFDHAAILEYGLGRLRTKLEWTGVGFELLPPKFTLSELQRLHEAILGRDLDKRNFRRWVAARDFVVPLKESRRTGRKPAQLFRFRGR